MIETSISKSSLEFQDEIEFYIREWAPRLDLQHWQIQVNLDLDEFLGTCQAEPEYMRAILSFNEPRMRKEILTRRALEELVLHELVHARLWALANVFVWQLDSDKENRLHEFLEEEAVTQMTGALLRAKYNGA